MVYAQLLPNVELDRRKKEEQQNASQAPSQQIVVLCILVCIPHSSLVSEWQGMLEIHPTCKPGSSQLRQIYFTGVPPGARVKIAFLQKIEHNATFAHQQ